MAHAGSDTPPLPSPSQLPPVPASPTPRPPHAVLTKTDLEKSTAAYTSLLSTAKSYRQALATLSSAASSFGSALESCARLKEARADILAPSPAYAGTTTSDTLLATAGLQHLVANHHQILSETLYRSFEVPLLHELDKWRAAVSDEEEGYQSAAKAQSREIRRLEKEGLKLHHRQRRRDVAQFREHLVELTTKLDGLTALHADHARTLLRESQETSVRIVDASCSLVRAEVDIFESLARKGWTGGGLEDVLEKGTDLFADPEGGDAQRGHDGEEVGGLFSILPPKSILADSASENNTASTVRVIGGGHGRNDSLTDPAGMYQSSTGMAAGDSQPAVAPEDGDSVFADYSRPRGGGPRPFSPQPTPLRINPDGLITGGYEEPSLIAGRIADMSTVENQKRNAEDSTDEGSSGGSAAIHARDEEEQPWRDEGLASETDSETPARGKHGQRPSLTSQDSRRSQRRWSVTEDVESP
jgi:hypothetical protein